MHVEHSPKSISVELEVECRRRTAKNDSKYFGRKNCKEEEDCRRNRSEGENWEKDFVH